MTLILLSWGTCYLLSLLRTYYCPLSKASYLPGLSSVSLLQWDFSLHQQVTASSVATTALSMYLGLQLPCYLVFSTALLWYFHIISNLPLKCTIQWLRVNFQSCAFVTTTQFWNISITTKRTSRPCTVSPIPPPPAPDAIDPYPNYRTVLLPRAAFSVLSLEKNASSLKAWVVIFILSFLPKS